MGLQFSPKEKDMENLDNRDKKTKKSLQPVIKFFSYLQKKIIVKAIFSFSDLNQEINQNEPPDYLSHSRTKSSQHVTCSPKTYYLNKKS